MQKPGAEMSTGLCWEGGWGSLERLPCLLIGQVPGLPAQFLFAVQSLPGLIESGEEPVAIRLLEVGIFNQLQQKGDRIGGELTQIMGIDFPCLFPPLNVLVGEPVIYVCEIEGQIQGECNPQVRQPQGEPPPPDAEQSDQGQQEKQHHESMGKNPEVGVPVYFLIQGQVQVGGGQHDTAESHQQAEEYLHQPEESRMGRITNRMPKLIEVTIISSANPHLGERDLKRKTAPCRLPGGFRLAGRRSVARDYHSLAGDGGRGVWADAVGPSGHPCSLQPLGDPVSGGEGPAGHLFLFAFTCGHLTPRTGKEEMKAPREEKEKKEAFLSLDPVTAPTVRCTAESTPGDIGPPPTSLP